MEEAPGLSPERREIEVDGEVSGSLMDLDSAQTTGKKRNRRRERSRKKKSNLLMDQVECVVNQTELLHLDEVPPSSQTNETASLRTNQPVLDKAVIITNVQSPSKKKKRSKKKNVAMASIQEISQITKEPAVQLMVIEASSLTMTESVTNVAGVASPSRSRPGKNGIKTNSQDSDRNVNANMPPSKSKNSRRDLNPIKQKSVCPKNNLSPSKQQVKQDTKNRPNKTADQMMKENKFEEHLPRELVEVMLREQTTVVKGFLRINQKNYREAYINNPDGSKDILIDGVKDRNRALEGDEVVVQISPQSQWREHEGSIQKVGAVIHILSIVHHRQAVGSLKKLQDGNSRRVLFSPRDSRVPRMHIPMNECPKNTKLWETNLFQARIVEWDDVRYAKGRLLGESIGVQGDIESETRAIMLENELRSDPYAKTLHKFFPKPPFKVSKEHFQNRKDLRKSCIFTIDPLTARDLDDAVSCEKMENGNYLVGVHISDVSFFLQEGTPLDKEVAERATTTYLVQRAYHMLPQEMTMMCSLLPGEDKLAFSVFWEMTPQAEVISHYFTRSVIRSCTQLAYEHAQIMIDEPDHQWKEGELPQVHDGWSVNDLIKVVSSLQSLAATMRKRRFDTGALRVNQTKLIFKLSLAGEPISFLAYENKESHRLIEEFMLLANMTVATDLQKRFPLLAFLRCHDEPQPDMLKKLADMLEKFGIMLDIASAGTLHESLQRYCGGGDAARAVALNSLCSRPMVRARYFCAASIHDVEFMRHYALNVPLYTHFTSPIRRYADVMVHRLLCAFLGYCDEPKWSVDYVQSIVANCNKMKFCAKKAGEQSTELFLAVWVKNNGTIETEAVVVDVKDRSFDAIICSTGTNIRVYTDKLAASVDFENATVPQLQILWAVSKGSSRLVRQVVSLFSVVRVALRTSTINNLKIEACLLPPE